MQADAETVVALLAVDPLGLGGVCLRARAGPAREAWLAQLRGILPQATAMRRVPVNISDTALLGGLDLAATLRAGRPVALQGLLPAADGGVLLLSMAERMPSETAARFCAVLDNGSVSLQRDGLDASCPARVALVALDEGASDDEAMPAALRERLAFWLVLDGQDELGADLAWTAQEVLAARGRLAQVRVDNAMARALCAAGMALGIDSLRAPLLALRAAGFVGCTVPLIVCELERNSDIRSFDRARQHRPAVDRQLAITALGLTVRQRLGLGVQLKRVLCTSPV